MLADIEDHLNMTIQHISSDIKVPTDEFDGKVIYGEKRVTNGTLFCYSHFALVCFELTVILCVWQGSNYRNHVQQMAPVVAELTALESKAQLTYLRRRLLAVR